MVVMVEDVEGMELRLGELAASPAASVRRPRKASGPCLALSSV